MPPTRTSQLTQVRQTSTVILLYNGRRICIPRPTTYNSAVESIQRCIPGITASKIRILAKVPERPDGSEEEAELTPEVWPIIASGIGCFRVIELTEVKLEEPTRSYGNLVPNFYSYQRNLLPLP
ncbi:hypothetical protein FRC02_007627, partial [Tulasnella sp. 418]